MMDINNFLSFQVHGAAGHGGDGVAGSVEALLTFLESLIGLSPIEMFGAILPGISAMANIHPLLVHFPIAFLSAFFLLDVFGTLLQKENWRQLATGLLYLGTLGAMMAVAAGLLASSTIEHGENVHEIMSRHQSLGITVMAMSIFLSIWRALSGGMVHGVPNIVFILLAGLLNFLMLLGADLGGLMVYKYGVAVEPVKLTTMDYFKEHTHSH